MRASASEEFRPISVSKVPLRQTSLEALPQVVRDARCPIVRSPGVEPVTKPPRRPASVESLPSASVSVPLGMPAPRLLASPLRGSPVRPAVQVSAQPLRVQTQVLGPIQVVPVLQTPRRVAEPHARMVRSESQTRACELRPAAGTMPAASPVRGPFTTLAPVCVPLTPHAPPPPQARSWQPAGDAGIAQQVWPSKAQQEQIARLTRQVQELKEQQLRHKQVEISAAALGTEPVTQMKPLEVSPFERMLVDLPTACRNKARASVPEVSLSSPRTSLASISASASKLRDAVGAYGLPAPPTPSVKGVEESGSGHHSFVSMVRRSLSPDRPLGSPGTSPEPLSFILQPGSPGQGSFAKEARQSLRVDEVRGPAPTVQNTTPPSPPRLSPQCGSTRLRLAERLDLASASLPGSLTTSAGPGGEVDGFHPLPWSLPSPEVKKPPSTDAGTLTSSSTSSSQSLRLASGFPMSEASSSSDQSHKAPEGVLQGVRPVGPVPRPSGSMRLAQRLAQEVTAKQLAELRSFRHPPAVVCQVLEAVAVILGVADSRWSSMRKLLDSNLLNRLCSLNPEALSPTQLDRLQTLLQVPTFSESLDERFPAVASLARWCNAVGGVGERPGEERPGQGGLLVEPDLWLLNEAQLSEVHDLTVTKQGIGCVTFHGQTDCRELVYCLPDVVVLNPGEVVIYPNQKVKPPVGSGLNKPSTIKLYGCLPKTQVFRDEKAREKYRTRVKTMTEEKGAEFIDYDCDQGVWQFRVTHF